MQKLLRGDIIVDLILENEGCYENAKRFFWNEFNGVVDFFNKCGESIDDMDYPLETEILEEKETNAGYWQVILNV